MVYLVISVGSGRGTTNPPPGEYVYPQGAVVAVAAIPDEGYIFVEFYLKNTARGTYYTSENPCTVEIPTGVPETLRVECIAYFEEAPPPPPPPDVVLESYRWEIEPGATFPYRPDDVRQAYRLYLKLKNEGGPGWYRVKVYLRGAPSYVWWGASEPELMWQTSRSIDAGAERQETAVLPEPKGSEYYEVAVITVETGVERWYKLEFPTPPGEEVPAPPPGEVKPPVGAPSLIWLAQLLFGVALIYLSLPE